MHRAAMHDAVMDYPAAIDHRMMHDPPPDDAPVHHAVMHDRVPRLDDDLIRGRGAGRPGKGGQDHRKQST
jgi:hypothetical protein